MNALRIIEAGRAAGVSVSIDGETLLLKSESPAPREVIDAFSRHKSEVIDFLRSDRGGWTVENWQAPFEGRAAIAEFEGGLPRREAEAGAFMACVVEWRNRNPVHSTPDRCCWCGGGERGNNVLLPFEVAGHAWLHNVCWRPWHEHRQAQAIAFLQGLGIAVPRDFPNDFAKNGGA